jgi:ribonuclease Z
MHPSASKPFDYIVVLGDTCDSSQIVGSGQGADVVVHECTLPDEMVHVASARGHSSPSMAGAFARALSARRLILTHFSARFTSSASGEVLLLLLFWQLIIE